VRQTGNATHAYVFKRALFLAYILELVPSVTNLANFFFVVALAGSCTKVL
jgi:hypothetical protein